MIPVTTLAGQKVAVFGLGGSGIATALAIVAGGGDVVAFDDNAEQCARAAAAGIKVADLRDEDWDAFKALVLSPGVPLTHPAPHWSVQCAHSAGLPVIGDIELFARERRAHVPNSAFIAITGTNGKSTTAALIAHLLQAAGRDVMLGGNIGTAVLSLPALRSTCHYVVECSSYQIDLAPSLDPSIGVLMNLAADHLDRHGSMDNYATIKERLVANSDAAVVGVDDRRSVEVADRLEMSGKPVRRISQKGPLAAGVYAAGTRIVEVDDAASADIGDVANLAALRGTHNRQNAAAAAAVARLLGVDRDVIGAALTTFPGLAHRMEEVGRIGRVLFINDSKATNADATAKALASFQPIYWIAGGLAKSEGITPLSGFFPRIHKAYLIGEAAASFSETLAGQVEAELSGDLATAVQAALDDARHDEAAEPVVLLSPACASFDQFENFEARGDAFRAEVGALSRAQAVKETI